MIHVLVSDDPGIDLIVSMLGEPGAEVRELTGTYAVENGVRAAHALEAAVDHYIASVGSLNDHAESVSGPG